jgi:hypothetical protein
LNVTVNVWSHEVDVGADVHARVEVACHVEVVQRRAVVDDHGVGPRVERHDLIAARVVERDVEAVIDTDDRVQHRRVLLRARRSGDPDAGGAEGDQQREPEHASNVASAEAGRNFFAR